MSADRQETVTFLCVGVVGSVALWERAPHNMPEFLTRYREILIAAVDKAGGRVFRLDEDLAQAAFPSAVGAATAAAELRDQPAVAWAPTGELQVRMALDTGDVRPLGEGYTGAAMVRCRQLLQLTRGQQILLSHATAALVRNHLPAGFTLHDLGAHHLPDADGAEPIFQLVPAGRPADLLPETVQTHRHNLPIQLTSFVGREQEVAAIRQALSHSRLLTLIGSCGCGKTRLALQGAADLLDQYPDGIWVADLTGVRDPSLVPLAVAKPLRVSAVGQRTMLESLTSHLQEKQALLVLDNCEHLLQGCVDLVQAVLRQCPRVRILATSREALNLPGETRYPVPSMRTPPRGTAMEQVTRFEAAALFMERAKALVPTFALSAADAAYLVELCARLDGIPLAIELAAARVPMLSLREISERLNHSFSLLSVGPRSGDPRHGTLRAAVDWSFHLLSAPEQTLFRRLSVFASSFTLEAAETICARRDLAEDAALDLVLQLAGRSLLRVERHEGGTRYRLPEVLRQYGIERLREAGEEQWVRQAFLDWYQAFARQAARELFRADGREWLDRMPWELENIWAALHFSRWSPETARSGLQIVTDLEFYWMTHGHGHEARATLEALLAVADPTPSAGRARALVSLGHLNSVIGEAAEAGLASLRQGEQMARQVGDEESLGRALHALGSLWLRKGSHQEAEAALEACLPLIRRQALAAWIGSTLVFLGDLARDEGDLPTAIDRYKESLANAEHYGSPLLLVQPLLALGRAYREQGEYHQAAHLWKQSLKYAWELGSTTFVIVNLELLGEVALVHGDRQWAAQLLQAGEPLRRQTGYIGTNHLVTRARNALGDLTHWPAAPLDAVVARALNNTPGGPATARQAPPGGLSVREAEVLHLVALGLGNKEIGERLYISNRTVDAHLRNIYDKVNVANRAELVAWAVRM